MIELKEGRYFVAMWVLDYPVGNVLIAVYRDNPDDKWTAIMRIRTYVDDKAHDSADPKQWFTTTYDASLTPEQVEFKLDASLPRVIANMSDFGFNNMKFHKYDIHSSDPKVAAKVMSTSSSFHAAKIKDDDDGHGDIDTDTWDTSADVFRGYIAD